MSQDLVLLTGATGLVGFRVLTELLDRQYKVRLALRSEPKIKAIEEALPSKYAAVHELEFIIVPDMAVDHAFDDAVKGVKYIVHVASPKADPSDDLEATLIKPAINTTLSILNSASKEPSVKKVVITSSVAAVLPTVPKVFDADNVEPDPQGPWTHPFSAYVASKKLALSATRRFIADNNPAFDIINVMPSFVIGPNGFAKGKEEYEQGSNRPALAPLRGVQFPEPRPGFVCHVDDVAFVHVAALNPEISGHRNFGVTYDGPNSIEWDTAVDIVKRRLPELVERGVFPLGGTVVTQKVPFEASKTERALGIKFKSFEDMIVDVANEFARVVSETPA
jgi:nucleoside-diphosphate-sugar epimerase